MRRLGERGLRVLGSRQQRAGHHVDAGEPVRIEPLNLYQHGVHDVVTGNDPLGCGGVVVPIGLATIVGQSAVLPLELLVSRRQIAARRPVQPYGIHGSILSDHCVADGTCDLRRDTAWQNGPVNGLAPSDLVVQLRILIAEEAFLWQLAEEVADCYWQASDCQQILIRWLDCGLINCIATAWATKVRSDEVVEYKYDLDWATRATQEGQHLVLARDDAAALLNDPSTWHADGAGAGVMLCESRHAHELPFDDWFNKLTGLPDHVIYQHPRDEDIRRQGPVNVAEPEQVVTARLWQSAMQQAVTGDLPVLCPINRDAHLAFDWEPAMGETATGRSIEDVFFFVNPGKIEQELPLSFGRHRLWCPRCGAQRHLVVTRKPG